MNETFTPSVTQEWRDARKAALAQDILSALTRRPADLLPFEEVRRKLGLRDARYLGVQNVPLDQIVGSVGRYRDFTRAFFPRKNGLQVRWQRIVQLGLRGGFPPVELYKVGQAFFVYDGNHRVSVARQQKTPTIEAYVWEYETRVPLEPDTDVKDLWNKAARAEFLERTNLDRICPDEGVELTDPSGYDDLLYEIEAFQGSLSIIDERDVPFDEAVALWYEMRYTPVVELVLQREVLKEFPQRTEADLYLWLRRNLEELEVRYGKKVLLEEAAEDLTERFSERPSPVSQIKRATERVAEGVGAWSGRLAEAITPDEKAVEDETLAAALLDLAHGAAVAAPTFRFHGTTLPGWEVWRAEFRERLWDLLGVGGRPWQPFGPEELQAEVEERAQVDGLWRELVWLQAETDGSTEGSGQGLRVPVYLFRPAGAKGPLPAIVVFPGHGTIAQTAGLRRSYQRANAQELARAGFVTLTVEPRGFGKLGAVGHLQIDAAARLVGRTWHGLLVQDAMRAIDYLVTRLEVDATRIGATGIDSGGALTLYTAALDDRIGAALVNSYLSKYTVICLDEEHCPCNHIPGILRYAEMGDVAALLAPRPALFVDGRRDPAASQAARESFAVARQVYSFLGQSRRVKLIEPERMGHYFDNQLAASWFGRWLVP